MRTNRWMVLGLLASAQFVVVLDVTIVNVALPHIQTALHFSSPDMQWVVNAYTLLFGGLLLLGGRLADLLGRRVVFIAGLTLFGGASLAAGLSGSSTALIASRAVQGLGGALLSPAALSLLTVTFAHGRERNIALGIWGALAGLGGTLGVIAGGLLVDAIGWRSVFFVNVPIGLALVALAPAAIAESRVRPPAGHRSFDALGALLGTAGLLALVLGIVRTQLVGWESFEVIGCLVAGTILISGFLLVETRAAVPLVPLHVFRTRGLPTGSLSVALNGAGFLAMFFLTAIFLQQVRGQSTLSTGMQLLPMGVAAVVGAVIASHLVNRVGTRPVRAGGALLSMIGLGLLSRASAHGAYASTLLPGLLLFGPGIVAIGVASQITAVSEVRQHEAGTAAGLLTAGYQIGGALGLAVITTIANARVTDLLAHDAPLPQALTGGFQRGLLVAAALAAVNFTVALRSPTIAPAAGRRTKRPSSRPPAGARRRLRAATKPAAQERRRVADSAFLSAALREPGHEGNRS